MLPTCLGLLLLATIDCSNDADDCKLNLEPCPGDTTAQGAGGATTATGGGGSAPSTGGGGTDPCGGCGGDTPHCMGTACVGCLNHSHCTEPGAAKCDPDTNTCVPCGASDPDAAQQCAGIPNATVCDEGTCVECALSNETACDTGAGQTCDLVAKQCVDIAPGNLGNCEPCTNDLQCEMGHRCIPMEFPLGTPHGHFCLAEIPMPPDECAQPYVVAINGPSISGHPATAYCGIDENLATCEAARALEQDWRCPGTDGKCCSGSAPLIAGECDPVNALEVDVPGAICRDIGGPPPTTLNRCTYACAGPVQCPTVSPQNTCGDQSTNTDPDWCGG